MGAERLGYQAARAQAEGGAAAYVGYFSTREKKGGALVGRATCDWLLGEGDMRGLVREAVDLWCRRRKDRCAIINTPNTKCVPNIYYCIFSF